ncbi:MAG: ABC transporter permease subunit [Actinomycetales bacterium]|nr:ABC transporter permease subunit [Actinomycetales bacterium]
MRRRPAGGRALITGGQASLALWFALPLVPVALWALASRWNDSQVLPEEWGPAGAGSALADGAAASFATSLALGLTTAALATPAGAMAAYALAFGRLRGERAAALLLLAPVFVPPFVIVMGVNVAFLWLRVPPAVALALVLMVTAIPYTTFVMRAALASYDIGAEEAARTLGASPRGVLRRIRIPMLAGGLAASAFLAFLVGWSDYVLTLLIGGGQLVTVPMRVAAAASGTGNHALVAALSVAAVAPPLLLLLVINRLSVPRTSRPATDADARERADTELTGASA